ncbi:MAG: polysaccharide biosynthesis protein [Holosporaceae bacterium]|nr:polysaccharide biosynthesis protein [Holosporaceae bacterium]
MSYLLKKIIESVLLKSLKKSVNGHWRTFLEKAKPKTYHIENILVLIAAYSITSAFIYHEFILRIYFKEAFSLICSYIAIWIGFCEKIKEETPFRILVGATACLAPILFLNNSFGAALICLALIAFIEFVCSEYLRGCNLFSNSTPIYVVSANNIDLPADFLKEYRVLEKIALSQKSIDELESWLRRINRWPFYPFPRKIITFDVNAEYMQQLARLSSEYGILLFRFIPSSVKALAPVILDDFEVFNSIDKNFLSSSLKNKRIWICYDGRGCILDLICLISSINSVDVSVFCESEEQVAEVESELCNKSFNQNYRIKIVDLNLLSLQGTRPDIFFYNMPIKSSFEEENLKEAVVKNVIDTKRLIHFSQSSGIPLVFVLSGIGAANARNWIGATQRLGELYAQFADSQNRKMCTKFKIVRIPEEVSRKSEFFKKVVSSILINGTVNINDSDIENIKLYYRRDILLPLLKFIVSAMKNHDTTSSVYTICPKNEISFGKFVEIVCSSMHLKYGKEINSVRKNQPKSMELDDFLNIEEPIEKTIISNVMRTKFSCVDPRQYDNMWSLEEISKMTTRDLISAVFQNLKEKTHSTSIF